MNLDEAVAIVNASNSHDLHTYGCIPSKKLENARSYPFDSEDTPVALVDATVFGSAKCGMVIGLKGIYWKNDWTTPTNKNFLSWEELSTHVGHLSSSFMTVTLAPDCKFNMSGSQMKSDQLIGLLRRLCAAAVTEPPTAVPAVPAEAEREEGASAEERPKAPKTPAKQKPVSEASDAPVTRLTPAAPKPARTASKGLLLQRQPDELFDQIKSMNTVQNVFNFAMAVLGDQGKNTEATKAFQGHMVRVLAAFRKQVVEKRGITELSNDLATMEACGVALALIVRMMQGRRVPEALMQQVLLEGLRATLNIQGTVQESRGGMIAMRLAAIYEDAAKEGPQAIPLYMALRLVGANLTGEISSDYDLDALVTAAGKDAQLEKLMDKLMPGLSDFHKDANFEANLLVGRILDLFPAR